MRLRELLAYDDIVIQCHDNPDADALASGYAVYLYLLNQGKQVSLVYGGRNIMRKCNLKLMVETLEIPISHVDSLPKPQLLLTVDCQYGEGNVTRFDAETIAVIDHHQVCTAIPELSEIRSSLGACATLVWQMLKAEGVDINENGKLATALYYGLYSDTNGFSELAHPLDKDLRDTAVYSKELMIRYRNSNLSLDELENVGAALMQSEYNEEYRFAVVKAGACDPNILGVISDLMLEVDAVDVCLVFSVMERGVKFSVRSCVKEVQANELADEISRGIGSGGGHLIKAGGYIQMSLLNDDYTEYCKQQQLAPRMELAEDGRSEHLSASAIKSFFMRRMKEYFENCEIIYANTYQLDNSNMLEYEKLPLVVGYVYGRDLFPVGTSVTLRTIEEDIETTIEEDMVLIIGIKGEIYLRKEEQFRLNYHAYERKYFLKHAEYEPTIRNNDNGKVLAPLYRARICIPCRNIVVMARILDHKVKVFTKWNEGKYLLGKPGDYLVVQKDDPGSISVIDRFIFEKSYRKADNQEGDGSVKAVIFDLDGTLLNTLEDLKDAVNYALRKNRMPLRTLEEIRQFVGNGILKLIERAVPEGQENPLFEKIYADFQEYYSIHCNDKTDVYPGIRNLLEELKGRGIAMAIVSNKVDSAVKNLNQQYFAEYISVAIGETRDIARKPAKDTVIAALAVLGIDKDEAIYVGDSDVDIQTAANAGMRCISVDWGFRDPEFLLANGANYLIHEPMELLKYI